MRTILLACLAHIFTVPVQAREWYTIQFQGDNKPFVGVVAGKPVAVVGAPSHQDWYLGTGSTCIEVVAPQAWKGYYLAYDPQGKSEQTLVLTPKKTDGTRWKVTHHKGGGVRGHTIVAESGKFKGWYLAVEKKGAEIKEGEDKVTAYRLYLVEKPKQIPVWDVTVISP